MEEHSKNASSQFGTLGILPPEIRVQIWNHVVSCVHFDSPGWDTLMYPFSSRYRYQDSDPEPRNVRDALAILRVSRAIFHEAVRVVYAGKRFAISLYVDEPAEVSTLGAYLARETVSKHGPIPGPRAETENEFGWWHMVSLIDIAVDVPPSSWLGGPLTDGWDLLVDNARNRWWELLALRRKVAAMVVSLRSASDRGLAELEILARDHTPSNESSWLFLDGGPVRTRPELPWNDVEIALADFQLLRNVRKATVNVSDLGPYRPQDIAKREYCFDFGKPLADRMMQQSSCESPDSFDRVVTEEIRACCAAQTAVQLELEKKGRSSRFWRTR